MKANELMIGDWVEFTSKYGYGKGQIAGIEPREGSAEPTTFTIIKMDEQGNTLLYVGVSKVCVRPVPLTAEILEMNGFVPDNFSPYYLPIKDGSIRFSKHQYGLYCNILRPYQRYDEVCNYIHNLQHALRECGIDKEIVL